MCFWLDQEGSTYSFSVERFKMIQWNYAEKIERRFERHLVGICHWLPLVDCRRNSITLLSSIFLPFSRNENWRWIYYHMMARIYDPEISPLAKIPLSEKWQLDGRRQIEGSKGGITIGNHVDIASQVMIWSRRNTICMTPTLNPLKNRCWLRTMSLLAPSHYFAWSDHWQGAVVAGAVVTKSVPSGTIIEGAC